MMTYKMGFMSSGGAAARGGSTEFDPVVRLFSALAHPIRAAVVDRLTSGEAAVGELADLTGASQPLVSHHLKVLREAHLVSMRRQGQRILYSLTDDHVASIFTDAHHHMKEHSHDCHH